MNQTTLLQRLTLEEKCALLSGKGEWETWNLPRAGVPSLVCSDGPHGIRRQAGAGDHLGLNPSLPATCFPTAATVAGSWDPELAEEIGRALGEEAAVQGVNIVLGPGLNIKRSPLCGRNFEYFSEDPYLSGKMAAGYIRGIQSQGVYACPKHFAVNSQELRRMAMNAVVDERTLREIYLTGFEIAVSEGHPGALMTSYNQVNGSYANENTHLLQDILRGEWGYDGLVITDWGGSNDHVEGVRAGSDLEMTNPGMDSARQLVEAVKSGRLPEAAVDILTGAINPSGRLSESYPVRYEGTPAYRYFPSQQRNAEYREGLYVGYRYYETAGVKVLFSFGYGLSYTTFGYSDLQADDTGVWLTVTNTGSRDGAEVVQLYISKPDARVFRPVRELKGFSKVVLKAGESQRVRIPFDDKTFRYWNTATNRWEVEGGVYQVEIGASCQDIRLTASIHLESTTSCLPYGGEALPHYRSGDIRQVPDEEFSALLGAPIPDGSWSGALTPNDAICQLYYARSRLARLVWRILDRKKRKSEASGKPDLNILFIYNMPFRAIAKMTAGVVSTEMVDGLVLMANGHFFRGLTRTVRGFFRNRAKNEAYTAMLLASWKEE